MWNTFEDLFVYFFASFYNFGATTFLLDQKTKDFSQLPKPKDNGNLQYYSKIYINMKGYDQQIHYSLQNFQLAVNRLTFFVLQHSFECNHSSTKEKFEFSLLKFPG
ncbi:hypothetical protein QQG55_26765 [Brugia pahangi]